MGWVASHISGRSAYQFVDEYQKIEPNSTLNFKGDHSIGLTIKPKENQLSYALLHKGVDGQDPYYFGQGNNSSDYNTLYLWVESGFLYLRLYYKEGGASTCLFVRTVNNVMNTTDVTHIEYTYRRSSPSDLKIYINGISVNLQILNGNASYYRGAFQGLANLEIWNSDDTEFIFGKSTAHDQFQGTIYDAYLYKKQRSGLEVSTTYNIVKDPGITSSGEKFLFLSGRNVVSQNRNEIFISNNKLNSPTVFATAATDLSYVRALVSPNNSINNTKICWSENNVGLVVANRDGSNKTTLAIISSNNYLSPVIGPQGNKIYFCVFNSGTSRYDLCGGDLSSTNEITNVVVIKAGNTLNYMSVDIKPDNTKLVCRVTNPVTGFEYIQLMNIDGSSPVTLQSFNDSEDITAVPRFNKSGTLIGYSRCLYNPTNGTYLSKIYTMTSTGGSLKQLEGDYIHCYFGNFSPDSANIVYYALPYGYYQIFKMDINGRNKLNLSAFNGFHDTSPDWLAA